MPGECLVGPEQRIGTVQSIEDPQNPETVVELEVVKVMRLGAREEREVVSRVGTEGIANSHREPQPGGGDVALHYVDAQERGQKVAENMLDWVAINRRYSHR